MEVVLTAKELAELDRQNPSTAADGGFQGLLVHLQRNVDRRSMRLRLTAKDLSRIARYAFDYNRGGWQTRLLHIFGRTLGPDLGRRRMAA